MALDAFQSNAFQTDSFQTGAAFSLLNVNWTAYPVPTRYTSLAGFPARFTVMPKRTLFTVHPPYEGGEFL